VVFVTGVVQRAAVAVLAGRSARQPGGDAAFSVDALCSSRALRFHANNLLASITTSQEAFVIHGALVAVLAGAIQEWLVDDLTFDAGVVGARVLVIDVLGWPGLTLSGGAAVSFRAAVLAVDAGLSIVQVVVDAGGVGHWVVANAGIRCAVVLIRAIYRTTATGRLSYDAVLNRGVAELAHISRGAAVLIITGRADCPEVALEPVFAVAGAGLTGIRIQVDAVSTRAGLLLVAAGVLGAGVSIFTFQVEHDDALADPLVAGVLGARVQVVTF